MQPGTDWPEIGLDALDPPRRAARRRWLPRRRPALGVHSTAAPTLIFVLLGAALGPYGLNVLTGAIFPHLDLVVSVALAIIGVFVGLGMATLPNGSARAALVGGAAALGITIATVTAGVFLLTTGWGLRLAIDAGAFAFVIGICSSVSAAVSVSANASAEMRRAAHLADVDDVPLVLLGTVVIAVIAIDGAAAVALRLMLTAGAGAAIGVAGWLLFDRASGPGERGVFVTGAVLLLAGIGSYLSTSPLLSGWVAALVWVRAPGAADRITAADLRVLQHPLVALLLIYAGALVEWTPLVLWVAGAVVVLRLTGKLLASVAVAGVARVSPTLLATVLLPPGVIGIALALNARQLFGEGGAGIVPAVTIAAVVSELLAMFLAWDHEGAA